MTTRPNIRREDTRVLKDIQSRVASLDETVAEFKDRVEERFDCLHQDVEEVKSRVDECLDSICEPAWYDENRYMTGADDYAP